MPRFATFILALATLSASVLSSCGGEKALGPMARLSAGYDGEQAAPVRSQVVIHFKDQATLDKLARRGVDLFENPNLAAGTVGATLTPKTEQAIKDLSVSYDVQVQALERAPMPAGYKTVDQVNADMADLAKRFPAIARRVDLGKSLEGRTIFALQITSKPDQGLPAVRIDAGQHARELPPVELTVRLMHKLVEGYGTDASLKALVDGRDIWVVPIVNPDGRTKVQGGESMWRKNTRPLSGGAAGVDNNRNCDIFWQSGNSQPWADSYRGSAPFSEPETRAMRDLCTRMKFKLSLDIHNFSGMVLWPPGHDKSFTKDEPTFKAIGHHIADPLGYKAGTIANTIYVTDGDLASWEYDRFGTLSFAAELDDSAFSAPYSEVERDWKDWSGNLTYLIDVAGHPKTP